MTEDGERYGIKAKGGSGTVLSYEEVQKGNFEVVDNMTDFYDGDFAPYGEQGAFATDLHNCSAYYKEKEKEPVFTEPAMQASAIEIPSEGFEMPSNIIVLKKLISQLPSGVSRHTGAQIIKQTMEALGISMKSVLQDAQQVQESLKVSARECQGSIQEYKKQILTLEKQSQNYQKQYSALNDLISLFIQTTK